MEWRNKQLLGTKADPVEEPVWSEYKVFRATNNLRCQNPECLSHEDHYRSQGVNLPGLSKDADYANIPVSCYVCNSKALSTSSPESITMRLRHEDTTAKKVNVKEWKRFTWRCPQCGCGDLGCSVKIAEAKHVKDLACDICGQVIVKEALRMVSKDKSPIKEERALAISGEEAI